MNTTVRQVAAIDSLRHIMAENDLTQRDVAELCCVSVKTVESWLAGPDSSNFRKLPPRHLVTLGFALPGFLGKRRTAAKSAQKGKK